jgi:phosphoribosylformimino-5-aminoimidazole carboxamide ribotide isomerase
VSHALVKRFGFATAYVADLDAISGAPPDWNAYHDIAQAGLRLWIDAGANQLEQALDLAKQDYCAAVVLGLESLVSLDLLAECVARLGSQRVIFSLDLMSAAPRTSIAALAGATPLAISTLAIEAGIRRIIVLDLAAVGTHSGPLTLDLGRELRHRNPKRERGICNSAQDVELIGGGGVRDLRDLAHFQAAGYDAVLVASALHDGRISPDLLRRS